MQQNNRLLPKFSRLLMGLSNQEGIQTDVHRLCYGGIK